MLASISVRRAEKRSLKLLCLYDAHEYEILDNGVLPFVDGSVGDSNTRQQLKRMLEKRYKDDDGKQYAVWTLAYAPSAVFTDFPDGDKFDSSMLQDRDGAWLTASPAFMLRRQRFIDKDRAAFADRVQARVATSTQQLSAQLAGLVNQVASTSPTPAAPKAVMK